MRKQPTTLTHPVRNSTILIGAPDVCWGCYVAQHAQPPKPDARKCAEAVRNDPPPSMEHPAIIPGSLPKWR